MRAGLPVTERERTVSRLPAARSCSFSTSGFELSLTVSQIDPVHAPCAPIAIAAAIWRPEPIPPAASTGVGATASMTSGHSTMLPTSPVCPPPS